MSWRDRASKAVKGATPELTKPTKAPFVSSVSSSKVPFPRRGPDFGVEDGRALAVQIAADPKAGARKAMALAYLDEHPEAGRACFVSMPNDRPVVILTVAVRDPRAALEMTVSRDRFDAMALFDLSTRYPGTSVFVPEH